MTALDTTVPIEPHQRGFGRRSRGRWRTYLIATLLLAAAAAVVAGCGDDDGDTEATEAAVVAPEARSVPTEDTPASSSPTTSDAPAPTSSTPRSLESDPGSWPTYTSTRYDFTVGHPSDWTEVPSSRGWSWETDIQDWLSPAHEAFIAPDDAIRVSAWNAPLDSSAPEESIDDLVAWVEDYCERSANTPCTGIADRAVELCLEARDCHPGLLVPFSTDVQAFFSGGIYDSDAMTIVAVWRSESHPSVAPYGGAQRLLESFLSTMEVWPATTPYAERN
jgi:hypothetical protein